MEIYHLKQCKEVFDEKIFLASSKSESNRALIINALSGNKGTLTNLSTARDTQTLIRLLREDGPMADVLDAGTTMRFLTAYFTVKNITKTMTGTARMCQRPIGILAEALKSMGAEIRYLEQEGYPPLALDGLQEQTNNQLNIPGDVSSQYISALLMIAPILPNGLTINILGEIGSIPYIKMTINQMRAFGVEVEENWEQGKLTVRHSKYEATSYKVESDWSGASYWYSVVALSPFANTKVELIGLYSQSLQGDSIIATIMDSLGVKSTFTEEGVLLEKKPANTTLEWDFTDCPDLAQTVAVVTVAKNIQMQFTGIESLKIKETDRVLALQNELKKIGGELTEVKKNHTYICKASGEKHKEVVIETYDDHRMAMAFAPLSMIMDLAIEDPWVVNKSYPSFWADFEKIIEIEK